MRARRLTCRFDPPEDGWLRLTVETLSQSVSVVASHTPVDSVSELAGVLVRVLQFQGEGEVSWNEEPDAVVTAFARRGDRISLRVDAVSGGRRSILLQHDDTARCVVAPFWSALKQLDADCVEGQFETGWRHPFPRDTAAQLERLLVAPAK